MIPALVVAASSLPAFVLARSFARSHPRLGTLLRLAGLAMLAGGAGLAWAAGDPSRTLAVALALALAINGLGVFVLLGVLRRRQR
ncbi:hypothetical protein LY625_07835 [Lysobacter sp. GX 14042]|uniref:hypothetical protein n=1 Tax=Lysobacter sp. GX 14042 TaxID=2907155 RepID=UPI001F28203E|nr:hypothetical protein [Lysobacter sp. GX 14042]MCE7032521.1 hypothetical protein [Lysobacter sp. GX 14042]